MQFKQRLCHIAIATGWPQGWIGFEFKRWVQFDSPFYIVHDLHKCKSEGLRKGIQRDVLGTLTTQNKQIRI
jgi:hypothetical protein